MKLREELLKRLKPWLEERGVTGAVGISCLVSMAGEVEVLMKLGEEVAAEVIGAATAPRPEPPRQAPPQAPPPPPQAPRGPQYGPPPQQAQRWPRHPQQ